MMKVTDLNGCPIKVTNLNEAIKITGQYMDFRHEDKSYSDFDERNKAYWTDMHNKFSSILCD